MHDLMTIYFTQGIILLAVLYLIFSGQIKNIVNKFMSIRRVKVGNTEIEAADCSCHEPERRKAYRRASDGVCAEHGRLVQTIESIEKKIAKIEEHNEETWIEQMKATFYSENTKLPLADKLYAGLRYVWWGQNGQMKSDVLTLCVNNKDTYQALTKLRPELKLEELEKKYKWPLA